MKRATPYTLLLLITLGTCGWAGAVELTAPAPVVMVCEHGSVKSVMAASLFNRAAAERDLPFRAVARGVTPDKAVPPAIAAALEKEGFAVKDFAPESISGADVSKASRIIAIGVDPKSFGPIAQPIVETWNDVPAASTDYAAARTSLQQHVEALLADLERQLKQ